MGVAMSTAQIVSSPVQSAQERDHGSAAERANDETDAVNSRLDSTALTSEVVAASRGPTATTHARRSISMWDDDDVDDEEEATHENSSKSNTDDGAGEITLSPGDMDIDNESVDGDESTDRENVAGVEGADNDKQSGIDSEPSIYPNNTNMLPKPMLKDPDLDPDYKREKGRSRRFLAADCACEPRHRKTREERDRGDIIDNCRGHMAYLILQPTTPVVRKLERVHRRASNARDLTAVVNAMAGMHKKLGSLLEKLESCRGKPVLTARHSLEVFLEELGDMLRGISVDGDEISTGDVQEVVAELVKIAEVLRGTGIKRAFATGS